jgi:ketosteroid isomerase-like protein
VNPGGETHEISAERYVASLLTHLQDWQEIEVQVLAPDAAIAGAIQTFNSVRSNGDVAEGVEAMTLVWKRQPEGWRVVHGHTTSR